MELANVITRVKGCTYLSVTTEKEFKKVQPIVDQSLTRH